MSTHSFHSYRRLWLKCGSLVVAGIAAARSGGAYGQTAKPGAAAGRVAESDPQAQALGYKLDASKVDKSKFPKYQAGETCATCSLFKGKPTDAWGPCDIFGGREVNAKGWCSAWVKKAG